MREGLQGYWQSAFIALNVLDHEMTNHYGLDPDSGQVKMVHKHLEAMQNELQEIEWIIEQLDQMNKTSV